MIFRFMMAGTSLWIVRRFWGIFLEEKKVSFFSIIVNVLFFFYQFSFQVDSANTKVCNIFISLLFMFLIEALGYECGGREKYFLLMILCCVWMLFEFAAYVLLNMIDVDPAYEDILGIILSKVFMVVTVFLLSVFWKKGKYNYIPGKVFLYLLLVPGGSIWLATMQFYAARDSVSFAVVLGILVVFNVVIFEAYIKIAEAYGEKVEQEVMRRQIAMYQNEFAIIRESDNNVRLLRHDLKKHMLLLVKYMEEGQYEEAKKYAGEIWEETKTSGEYVKTGNGGVDSIVNYMLARAGKLGVRSKVTVQVPETPFMPDFDLNMLLGNLLENALEALEKAEEKTLDFYMSCRKQVLYISLCNTFDGKVRKKGNVYLTTKRERGEHGLGLTAVERIVEKYHGEMRIEHTEKMFGTDIALYVSENEGKP